MRKFVIDTSVFVNPQVARNFGPNPKKALQGFIKLASKKKSLEFYMPGSIFNELRNFVHEDISKLELLVKRRSPNLYAVYLPAAVFYDFIEEMRNRMNKGLRLAEDFARDNKENNDEKVRKLRDMYKDAMRSGFLDSKEDLELVLLAKELEAALVSADEGVLTFGSKIGCETLHASKLKGVISKK